MIHTDAFPPILLVVQFECGSVGRSDETHGCIPWEASELATAIFLEEQNIFVLELNSLFGVIP